MEDILSRKEFQVLKHKSGPKPKIPKLHYSIQQLFVARWMMQDKIRRLFLIHDMGSGKTITSLLSADENRTIYKLLGEGNIIIISFQKNTFMNEMLSRPELGYVTQNEYEKLKQLQQQNHTEVGMYNYNSYVNYLKKNISGANGLVKFFGYQELYNMINIEGDDGKSEIHNKELIELFANSFVICDEIHNTYNSQEMNLYGDTIKRILSHYYGREDEPHVLFMSGTPINNKPSEVIDILNLITDKTYKKTDFFKLDGEVEQLLPGALGRISSIARGYFSFYINEDISIIPRRVFDGKNYNGLYITECDYTAHQAKIIKSLKEKINIEDNNIFDATFPSENGEPIYRNADFNRYNNAPQKWKDKMGIIWYNGVLSGPILKKENIKQWSHKYWSMLDHLDEFIKNDARRGKLIIYHDYINGTGIKLMEQIMIMNGYLSETGIINDNCRCSHCGITYAKHVDTTLSINGTSLGTKEHIFEPIRFLSLYGELDNRRINTIMEYYNSESNVAGNKYMILLGSAVIREGVNFKAVREIWSMHILPHISALLQLWGRAIRTYSHEMLPTNKREVHIKIFATAGEIDRYVKKLKNYRVTQQIMKVINEEAIDRSFYYDLIERSFTKSPNQIGLLKYPNKKIHRRHQKLDTYNVFYGEWEIEEIKKTIVALFIQSAAWSYADLLRAVRDPPFIQHIDYSGITEDNFILALGDMIYSVNPTIIHKNGTIYRIAATHNASTPLRVNGAPLGTTYYVIYPTERTIELEMGKRIENVYGKPIITHLSWMQPIVGENQTIIPITENLLNLNTNYEEMKYKFFTKFAEATMLDIPRSTEVYGIDFHMRLIEEAIQYIFNILTGINKVRSEYHEFYFKMVHFYNKIDIIIYADMLPEKYFTLYKNYVVGVADELSMIKSTLANVSSSSISSFEITAIDNIISKNKGKKVKTTILPVGHMLSTATIETKLYTPQGWFVAKDYTINKDDQIENDLVIGYYSRADNSINFKFKLRNPIHKIDQKKDRRELEKGMVCETNTKKRLEEIARKLNITITGTNTTLCDRIKEKLLYLELKDRNKYRKGQVAKRTRWCYMQYEN